MGIILAILVFGLIVTIHELGHFLLAKKNGIHVEEFSIRFLILYWHLFLR